MKNVNALLKVMPIARLGNVIPFLPKKESGLARTVKDIARPTLIISPDTTNWRVLELFHENEDVDSLPICDVNKLMGVIVKDQFMEKMARRFHTELFGKKPCVGLADKSPLIVEGGVSIQELASLLEDQENILATSFIVVEHGEVIGTGLARDVFAALVNLEKELTQQLEEHQDLLEQRVHERTAELSRAEAQTRLILESTADGIFGVNAKGVITFVNNSASRILGYLPEQLVGKSAHHMIHASHFSGMSSDLCPCCRVIFGQSIENAIDDYFCHADGTIVPVLYSVHPMSNRASSFGTVITFVDMTERHKLEAERSLLAAIVSSSQDAIVSETLNGIITTWNDGAYHLFGYYASEAIGKPLHFLIPGIPSLDDCLRAKEENLASIEAEIFHKEGGRITVLITTSLIKSKANKVIGVSHLFRDITQQKLANEAREQALKESERLAQARSDFLANMSHEIRTPLNGVLGMAQVGIRDTTGTKALKCLNQILTSGKLLLGIVNDILDFSKIESGRMAVESIPVNVAKTLGDIHALHVDKASAKGLYLHLQLSPRLPKYMQGDPTRLSQVLGNLVSNAIKFTEKGGVIISAVMIQEKIVFSVTDTGIGIEKDKLNTIFQPFEQADTSTTRKYGGTGLGLAICARLVECMGGEITVSSLPEQGSKFEVSLLFEEVTTPIADFVNLEELDNIPSAVLKGLQVLVVEDNPINRFILEEMLREEGASVRAVSSGEEAVQKIISGELFHVVLMDIQMPGISGHEATRQILEIRPNLPIIGQTAHALPHEIEKCKESGMVGYIPKPIESDVLIAVLLKNWVKRI